MNNEATLIDLGFSLNEENQYQFTGKHQTFVATISEEGSKNSFINLGKFHPDIDQRPKSIRNGKHFVSSIKSCASLGSVERAMDYFDVPEERFGYMIGGCFLKEVPGE